MANEITPEERKHIESIINHMGFDLGRDDMQINQIVSSPHGPTYDFPAVSLRSFVQVMHEYFNPDEAVVTDRTKRLAEITEYMNNPNALRVSKGEAIELDIFFRGYSGDFLGYWNTRKWNDFPNLSKLRINDVLRARFSGYVIGERSTWMPMELIPVDIKQAIELEHARNTKASMEEMMVDANLSTMTWSDVNRALNDGYIVTGIHCTTEHTY